MAARGDGKGGGMRIETAVARVACTSVDIRDRPGDVGMSAFKARIYNTMFGFRHIPVAGAGEGEALLSAVVRDAIAVLPSPSCVRVALHAHTGPMVGVFGAPALRRALRDAGASDAVPIGLCSNRCVSIFNALDIARRWLRCEPPGAKALLVTGETAFTQEIRVMENVALAGDAAGALVLSLDGPGDRLIASDVRIEGRFAGGVWLGQGLRSEYERSYQDMMAGTIHHVLAKGNTALGRVSWLLPHNINVKSWAFLADRMGFPADRVIRSNVERTGHCFGTDMMLNLISLRETGCLCAGDRYLMAAAGLGGVFGAALFECR